MHLSNNKGENKMKEKEEPHNRHFSIEMDNVEMVIEDMENKFDTKISGQNRRLILNLVNHYTGGSSVDWVQITKSLVADFIF